MARELVAQEDELSSTTRPTPTAEGTRDERGEPVEPPEALENQGDFPTLTDQGKGTVAPNRDRYREAEAKPIRVAPKSRRQRQKK